MELSSVREALGFQVLHNIRQNREALDQMELVGIWGSSLFMPPRFCITSHNLPSEKVLFI